MPAPATFEPMTAEPAAQKHFVSKLFPKAGATKQAPAKATVAKAVMPKPVATKAAKPQAPKAAKPQAAKLAKPQATRALKPAVAAKPFVAVKPVKTFARQPAKALPRRPVKPQTLVVPADSIDTSLAAQVAASMVANHLAPPPAAADAERAGRATLDKPASGLLARRETSTFRHMKENLAKPPARQLDGVLGFVPKKKTHVPVAGTGFVPGQSIDKDYGLEVRPVNPLRRKAG